MVTSVSNNVSSDLLTTMNGSSSAAATDASQDKFLKLLVTQMKNQDPLNPMDNAQVTSQMAQLSTVSGINQLNSSIQGMRSDLQANQTFGAAELIGHAVSVKGAIMELGSKGAAFGLNLNGAADSVKVLIKDSAGQVVKSMDLGAGKQGPYSLTWDGVRDDGATAAQGNYTFSIEALKGQEKVSVDPVSYSKVISVSSGSSGVKLNLSNGNSAGMNDVTEVV